MRNVPQAGTRRQENIPAGASQHRRRPRNPFLSASEYQFADGADYPRRAKHLQWLKRQVCRAFVLNGMDRTAAEISQFTGIPRRTVERTILLLLVQGFLSNVGVLPARDRHGKRLFKRERMLRKLNPQALLPFNVAVCYGQSGGDNTPKNLKSSQDGCDTDSSSAQSADEPRVAPKVHPTPKPKPHTKQERIDRFVPRDLLRRFCKEFSYTPEEGSGRLGWIVTRTNARKQYRNTIGPVVRNVWKYICAANRSIDDRTDDPGGLDWLITLYSFADMYHLDLCDPFFD